METQQMSPYGDYLPAYLQTDPFLQGFLRAFEQVLSGLQHEEAANFKPQILTKQALPAWGLETIISQIHTYLDPIETPAEFLSWLAGWVALSLWDDWDDKVKRKFISQMVPLYQIRGTVPGLKKILQLYLESCGLSYPERTISIFEFDDHPHYFQVQLALPSNQVIQPERYWRECRAAKAIIDLGKPAHTFYALRILTLTMQLTKAWGSCYGFMLFDSPLQQKVQIEASIKLNHPQQEELERQILIRIQGKTAVLEPNGSQLGPIVRQTVFYKQLLANPNGFFVALDNLSDRYLDGTLTVKLNFNLDQQRFSLLLFESPFSLEPNLRIYRPLNHLEAMPGNTRLDVEPQRTMRLEEDPPLSIYQPQMRVIDGNSSLGYQINSTMRLVHDARLRVYLPRFLPDKMDGTTRLGSQLGDTMQLPRDRENPRLKIYQSAPECKVGNTRLGAQVGYTMRLVSTSQWLERLYWFKLFEPPATQDLKIEVLVQPEATPDEFDKVARLLIVRMQSLTSSFSPFTPNLEFSSYGIRATHRLSYQRFLDNPRGFYVVLTNINDRQVIGKITIKLNFTVNKRPVSLVILEQDFSLPPRNHVLKICYTNQSGEMEGNTIIGRVTPYTLQNTTHQEDDWVD